MNSAGNSDHAGTKDRFLIAIDGYSSCGKSTFARRIAAELGFIYIDSGAMYRSVALFFMENGIPHEGTIPAETLSKALGKINIRFSLNPETSLQETWLNGVNVEDRIRSLEVSSIASAVSQIPEVRQNMVHQQRKIGINGRVVMDGRDIGTVVFPDAKMKIFMTADPEVRAKRRFDELAHKGIKVDLDEIAESIRMRDHEDENRRISPLRKADDALILDNSHMTVDEQM